MNIDSDWPVIDIKSDFNTLEFMALYVLNIKSAPVLEPFHRQRDVEGSSEAALLSITTCQKDLRGTLMWQKLLADMNMTRWINVTAQQLRHIQVEYMLQSVKRSLNHSFSGTLFDDFVFLTSVFCLISVNNSLMLKSTLQIGAHLSWNLTMGTE